VVEVLGRLARLADEAHAALDAEVTRVLPEVVRPPAGRTTVLDAARLGRLPAYLAREVLRTVWQSLGWPMDAMTAAHWDRLMRIIEGAESAADFPGGVHARRAGAVVQLGRKM
jgi:hypothetical protein